MPAEEPTSGTNKFGNDKIIHEEGNGQFTITSGPQGTINPFNELASPTSGTYYPHSNEDFLFNALSTAIMWNSLSM